MKPPIYVYEPDDLGVYSSVAHAELDIEPTDVKDGIYFFYDSNGQRLGASVLKDERGIERCIIKEILPSEFVPEVLKQILIDQLEYFGEIHDEKGGKYLRTSLEVMSLPELVAESLVLRIR